MPTATADKPAALAAVQRGEDPKTVAARHGVAWPTMRVWMSRWRKSGEVKTMKAAATWEDISSLTPWDKNPRHNTAAIEQVRKSIERFGFSSPIIARQQDRIIIAGHTRHQAALKMGLDKVPVRFLDLDPAQARALALADNKLGEVADWDDGQLAEVLAELEAESVDLDGLGWSDEELAALLDPDDQHQEPIDERLPEPPVEPNSQPGTWYELGPHRLYCGDCRDVADWGDPGCLIYDPPWDSDIVQSWSPPSADSVLAFTDGARIGDLTDKFGRPAWCFVWDGVSSWWTPNRPLRRVKLSLWFGNIGSYNQEGAFYRPEGWSADEEARAVQNTRGSYQYTPHPEGRRLSDLYRLPLTAFHASESHSHAKPIEWVSCLIANTSTGPVADPFAGGGSSLMAADRLGRTWIGAEADPAFCDVIRERWNG